MDRATWATDDRRLRDMVARLQDNPWLNVSSDTTLTAAHNVVRVDTSGGNVTITLPDARTHSGKVYRIKKIGASNTLTVQGSGSDQVDRASSSAWTTADECRRFESGIVTAPATWGWEIT